MRCGTNIRRIATVLFCAAAISGAGSGAAEVVKWHQDRIASPAYESHPAFDPLTGDFYFVRSKPDFSGWRMFVSHCTKTGWSEPEAPSFAGDGVEADPFFTPDGKSLYFISTRTTDGIVRKDLDIWRVDRDASGKWGTPVRLPAPINSDAQEWFPRLQRDGWLYFGSARPGGLGKNDIYRARQDANGAWQVENLGPAINSAADEYEAELSPDGKRMLINSNDGFYESTRTDKGWTPKVKLGPEINVNGSEVGALFSPSGKSFLFARDLKEKESGEFFLSQDPADKDWPPKCPR